MNSIQPVSLQPNTQPALNANEQRITEAVDTEYTLQSNPSIMHGVRGCAMLTTERVIWTAADAHVVHQPHGKLGVPLHCVSDLKEEGGGGLFWTDPYKLSFAIKPMYENAQPPEKFILTFHRGGREDRDRFFGELARILREKPWQPAPVVNAPVAAPQVLAPAPTVAAVKRVEPSRPDPDADGIFVILPGSEGGRLAGGAAATSEPVPPARCGFDYDFLIEHKYAGSNR